MSLYQREGGVLFLVQIPLAFGVGVSTILSYFLGGLGIGDLVLIFKITGGRGCIYILQTLLFIMPPPF